MLANNICSKEGSGGGDRCRLWTDHLIVAAAATIKQLLAAVPVKKCVVYNFR